MTDSPRFVDNPLRITCADAIELMTDFLDNALARRDLADFETHLTQCEGCRVYLDQLRHTITLTAESRDSTVEVTPANFDELAARFARHSSHGQG
jgi:predicted anti-sigma-YlaC factor YlaD